MITAWAGVAAGVTPTWDSTNQLPEAGLATVKTSLPAPVEMSSGVPGPLSVPSGAKAKTSMSFWSVLFHV